MADRREFAIYISSTVEDLEVERKIAIEVIGSIGTVKHSYRAADQGVVKTCIRDVRKCDLYIGILGQRYGYVPDGEDNPNAKSITELEYEACEDPGGGRKPIPRLIFIKPTNHNPGIDPKYIDALTNPKTRDRMAAFLKRANGPSEVAFQFKSAEQFRAELQIRVTEKATEFHSGGAQALGMLGGTRLWRTRLKPVAVAVTPGSDSDLLRKIRTHGAERFSAFELSPNSADYLFDADRCPGLLSGRPEGGFASGQLGCLIVTPASLGRFTHADVAPKVDALIDMQVAACGRFVLACADVDPEDLLQAWRSASKVVYINRETVAGLPQVFVNALYEKVSASAAEVSTATRLPLPYLVLAPTRERVEQMLDPHSGAFDEFPPEKVQDRRDQFGRIADAARKMMPDWPAAAYGKRPEEWCCFAPAPDTAEQLILRAIERTNGAAFGSRERRLLQEARLVPRRYRAADFITDHYGSRRLINDLRQAGCLIVVDELALLDPVLRSAAEELLSGARSAIASVSAFDPAHSSTQVLLGRSSHLRVGTVIERFRMEHDPRCEVAINSVERIERWLRYVIPELVVNNDEQELQPELAAKAHLVLRGAQGGLP